MNDNSVDTINGSNDVEDSSQQTNFASSIKKFINYIDNSKGKNFSLLTLCKHFNIQRRRFYDVINVLAPLKFCKKTGKNEITWLGEENFLSHIESLKHSNDIKNIADQSGDQCISISELTLRFLQFFYYSGKQVVHIKDVSVYLSQDNGRVQTTTCKLYQISHILQAVGIVEKTDISGEKRMADKYYNYSKKENVTKVQSPFSIEELLNYPPTIKQMNTESNVGMC